MLSEGKANSFTITQQERIKTEVENTPQGDTLQIPQITLPGIKFLNKSKSNRSPSDGDQLSTLNTEDSMESGNDTPSCFSHSIISNSDKLSRGSGHMESQQQLMRRSFFASSGTSKREKSSPSPPKSGLEELQKDFAREKKAHFRHFSDLTSSQRLGLTSRHHVHRTLQGIESKSKRSHTSKTSARLHQAVRRNFNALIKSTDIVEKREELKRLNSSELERRTKPLSIREWQKQHSEIEGISQCPREKMLRVHRLIKIARATQQNRPFALSSQKDDRISSMVQGWMKGGKERRVKKSKEMQEEETLSKIVSLHNQREQRQRPATVRQSSVI